MAEVTVSSEFKVVVDIPEEARETLGLQPGERLRVFHLDDRIELIPIRPMREMRGFVEGLDTSTFERDPDRL
ncbi:MAG TPA: AbrB/MazE/SpoVT family DNA-binding domain-containing protein [Thermoanaerobaculia bacterium]|nr:AbrB/MazE/SpoVT family DNA-binding domain-containing protein [Thermoanaerobaculia bacterium]